MKAISIFNHVLGPVMRGPSSSHTAGAFHIGSMARSLLGGTPMKAVLTFDPDGSYAATYVTQGADRGFAMGLLGKPLTDDSFFTVLDTAPAAGMQLEFRTEPLPGADHPNTTNLDLTGAGGRSLRLVARSVGGGAVEITRIDGRPVLFDGTSHEVLVEVPADRAGVARDLLGDDGKLLEAPEPANGDGVVRWTAKRKEALAAKSRRKLELLDSQALVWQSAPVYFVPRGEPLFASAAEIVKIAEEKDWSLGRLAIAHESQASGAQRRRGHHRDASPLGHHEAVS